MTFLILLFSNILHLAAGGYVTIQLFKNKILSGWGIMFLIIWVMSLQRLFTLANVLTNQISIDLWSETIALVVFMLWAAALIWIKSLFRSINALREVARSENTQKNEVAITIQNSEERCRLAEQAIGAGIWDWDVSTNKMYLSPKWTELLGYELHELDNWDKITTKIFSPQEYEKLYQEMADRFKSDSVFDIEIQLRHKEGSYKWYQIKGSAIRNMENRVTRIVGAITDIQLRKEAEFLVELENELLQSNANDVPIGNLLDYLIRSVERQHKHVVASITYLDSSENLNCHVVAPNLPMSISKSSAHHTIGFLLQSTHARSIRNDAVFHEHIHEINDWSLLKNDFEKLDIQSYWSFPIVDEKRMVLGMFDFYSKKGGLPSSGEYLMIEGALQFAMRIIVKHHEDQRQSLYKSLYQTIFEQVAVGVALVDVETGDLLHVNARLCQMLDRSLEATNGLSLKDFVYSDDLDLINSESLKLLKSEKRDFNIELRILDKEGSVQWIEVSASLLGQTQENKNTYVAVFQDITSRKKTEENLRFNNEVLENTTDCILVVECKHKEIVYTNSRFNKMFGYVQDEILGVKIRQLISPDVSLNQTNTRDVLHSLRQTNQWKGELKSVRKNGTTFWSRVNLTNYNHPTYGQSWLCVSDDISIMREAVDAVIRIEKLEGIGVLAGGIAHDFNNILVGVFANLSMIQEKINKDHEVAAILSNAMDAMKRAKGLTTQLLTFSKGGEPIKENTDIAQLITSIVQFELSGSNVQPVFDIQPHLWDVGVDRGQIEQVFSNLTINALAAMPNGGHIFCKIENWKNENIDYVNLPIGNYLKITFRDDGTGIELSDLGQIFDPYYTTKAEGNGLGLSIIFSIIKRHLGNISVDSKINEGTTFTILLPSSAHSHTKKNKKVVPPNKKIQEGTRVLILDDQEMVLKAVQQILGDKGIKTDVAKAGAHVIELYRQSCQSKDQNYDLVILDLTIPGGIGGKEVIKEILKLNPLARVLASSGYTEDDVMANYKAYGFCGIVPKPYTMDELLNTLNLVLSIN